MTDDKMKRFEAAQEELVNEGVAPFHDQVGFLVKAARRAGWTEGEIAEMERSLGAGLQ